MRSRICLVIALMTLTAFGWLRSYEVLPTQAAWSGWTSAAPGSWVGNTLWGAPGSMDTQYNGCSMKPEVHNEFGEKATQELYA